MINILIVDDNIFYAKKLMDYINKSDKIKVTNIAINGKEAIEILNNRDDIDIFLLDLKIPKYNGLEVLDMINEEKREKYRNSCIVISGEIELVNKLRNNYMINNVLQKTISFSEISEKIMQLVKQKELYAEKCNIEKGIKKEMLHLGYNMSHKGTMYLVEAIKYVEEQNNGHVDNLKKEVYPYIAKINRTSIHNVKCNIARATENMYYNCETERLKKYFKFQELRKPAIKTIIQTVLLKI